MSKVRQRKVVSDRPQYSPLLSRDGTEGKQSTTPDVEDALPFGGKVFLARQKKPDSWFIFSLEMCTVALGIGMLLYAYYYFDHLHYNVNRFYAHLGYPQAQHVVGHKLLHGIGVEKHTDNAMYWFSQAAKQGHPHASYNLAIGHLKGMHQLAKGEVRRLIEHAAENGVREAHHMKNEVCLHGGCD